MLQRSLVIVEKIKESNWRTTAFISSLHSILIISLCVWRTCFDRLCARVGLCVSVRKLVAHDECEKRVLQILGFDEGNQRFVIRTVVLVGDGSGVVHGGPRLLPKPDDRRAQRL